jgi:hypothetical protein
MRAMPRERGGAQARWNLRVSCGLARALGLAVVALSLSLGTLYAEAVHADEASGAAAVKPLAPNPAFAHFPAYDGTLGSRRIVLRLGRKPGDDPTAVQGEYQFADTGEVVLVAGDRVDDILEIEESTDGTTITGNWAGRFSPDGSVSGDRMNADDSNPVPFDLHPQQPISSPTD